MAGRSTSAADDGSGERGAAARVGPCGGAKAPPRQDGGCSEEVGQASVVHLPCTPASVAVARRAVAADLRSAGVFDAAVCDAALVVSELMSNAILHAYPLPGERLQLSWAMNGSSVEVAVSDGGGTTLPQPGRPSLSSLGGRGLNIVAHLSLSWGVRADDVGLTVWAVLSAPRGDGTWAAADVTTGAVAQA